MAEPLSRSSVLGRIQCPSCGQPVELKTDKRGKAYLHCSAWRTGQGGAVYPCHFHAKWGAQDSAELVKIHLGGAGMTPPEAANSPEPPKPERETAQPDRNETESEAPNVHEPGEPEPHPERHDTATGADEPGGFLGS